MGEPAPDLTSAWPSVVIGGPRPRPPRVAPHQRRGRLRLVDDRRHAPAPLPRAPRRRARSAAGAAPVPLARRRHHHPPARGERPAQPPALGSRQAPVPRPRSHDRALLPPALRSRSAPRWTYAVPAGELEVTLASCAARTPRSCATASAASARCCSRCGRSSPRGAFTSSSARTAGCSSASSSGPARCASSPARISPALLPLRGHLRRVARLVAALRVPRRARSRPRLRGGPLDAGRLRALDRRRAELPRGRRRQAPAGEPEALLAAAEAALLAEDPGPSAPVLQRRLFIAAEAFRADLARRPGIVAGYPELDMRGRDALMALPASTSCRRRPTLPSASSARSWPT